MALARTAVFQATLATMGVPFTGIQVSAQPPGPTTVTVDYAPEATAEQISAGNQLVQTFDWRPRQDLTPGAIASQIAGLTLAQEVALRRRILARVLLSFAQDAQDIIAALNLPLAVDEVVP